MKLQRCKKSKGIVVGISMIAIAAALCTGVFLIWRSGLSAEEKAEQMLKNMTLHEKVCQMLIVLPESLGYEKIIERTELLKDNLQEYPVGGFLMKGQNMESPKQVKKLLADLQRCSKFPLFMASDEEGGTVSCLMRKVGTTQIGPMFEYRNDGVEKAYQNAFTIASDMSGFGFNLDFAPVADVWSNPENMVINNRAYSDDFEQAAQLVASAVKGFHDGGVATSLKHFPGHGDTAEDSHYSSAYVTKTLEELRRQELLPFESGIEAGSDMVMLGHLIMPEFGEDPILFSHDVVTGLLREELGFDGVVITDALDMAAVTDNYSLEEIAVRAVAAGVDMLLCPSSVPEVVAALEDAVLQGTLSEEQIDESVLRILEIKGELGLLR